MDCIYWVSRDELQVLEYVTRDRSLAEMVAEMLAEMVGYWMLEIIAGRFFFGILISTQRNGFEQQKDKHLKGTHVGISVIRFPWDFGYFKSFFPECVARVPVSLWGVGVELCSPDVAQPFATVRNRQQPCATVRSLWPCLS